jgi:hypothetical protein
MNPELAGHIAAGRARLDQMIEQHREGFAELEQDGMTRDEIVATMISTMLVDPPRNFEEFASLGAIAILAVDRLAHQERPNMPEIDF